jgi:hypothetical protein
MKSSPRVFLRCSLCEFKSSKQVWESGTKGLSKQATLDLDLQTL